VTPPQIKEDLGTRRQVPSDGALTTQELSISIGSETTPAAVIAKGAALGVEWRLWEFSAGSARRAGCIVDRDPQPEDAAHAVVLRADRPGERLKGSTAKKLIVTGRWQDET
jgi:hypothetical protein